MVQSSTRGSLLKVASLLKMASSARSQRIRQISPCERAKEALMLPECCSSRSHRYQVHFREPGAEHKGSIATERCGSTGSVTSWICPTIILLYALRIARISLPRQRRILLQTIRSISGHQRQSPSCLRLIRKCLRYQSLWALLRNMWIIPKLEAIFSKGPC